MTSTTNTAQVPKQHHFLSNWFELLVGRVFVSDRHTMDSHNVRVEASGSVDWWIQVQASSQDRCPSCGYFVEHEEPSIEKQELELRQLREALVLVALYSRIDYDHWLQNMIATSGLRFARDTVLPCRFGIVLSSAPTVDGSFRTEAVRNLVGQAELSYSDKFRESYARLLTLAKQANVQLETLNASIPLRLEFSQLGLSLRHDVDALREVADCVIALRQSNATPTLPAVPGFHAGNLELRLSRHDLHPSTLFELGRLVDTGVFIKHLSLPSRVKASIDSIAVSSAWEALVDKLFQRSSAHDPRVAMCQIDRLELPPVFFTTTLAVPWLRALRNSNNVRSLSVLGRVLGPTSSSPFSTTLGWALLAYSLFSRHRSNNVESVDFSDFGEISIPALAAFSQITSSSDPLKELQHVVQSLEPSSEIESAAVRAIMAVKHKELASTTQIGANLQLRTLVLKAKSTEQPVDDLVANPPTWIAEILRVTGEGLTSLAVEGTNVGSAEIRRWLALCPQLANVRVMGADLDSMDLFREASVSKISSLDLGFVRLPSGKLELFLEALASDSSMRQLQRLRVGQRWTTRDAITPSAFLDSIRNNRNLSYLHVFRPTDPVTSTPSHNWDELVALNGTLIASREQPLPMEAKLAFLASIRHVDPTRMMNSDVVAQVFDFAAIPRRRTVLVESDSSSLVY